MKNESWLIYGVIGVTLVMGLIVITFKSFQMFSTYNACKIHYPNEVITCVFSDRYRVVE